MLLKLCDKIAAQCQCAYMSSAPKGQRDGGREFGEGLGVRLSAPRRGSVIVVQGNAVCLPGQIRPGCDSFSTILTLSPLGLRFAALTVP
jgi:hypothetical protein